VNRLKACARVPVSVCPSVRLSGLLKDLPMNRLLPRLLLTPAVATLFLWMIVPLVMTVYFSVIRFNLLQPDQTGFVGLDNFEYFITDPSFSTAVGNTLLLLGSVIGITVLLGVAIALLINEPFAGRGLVRVLLISPFFVMPTVNALLWKNMMMNPIYGLALVVGDCHGVVAMVALCHPDLHDGLAKHEP
jgi:ABC-type sugar transport system permease subunit